MRKLTLQQFVSLDGFCLEQGTEFWTWWAALPNDDEAEAYLVDSLRRRAGTHVMGRVTYEGMAAYWPSSEQPIAPIMNDVPKVVFSQTLESADWPESRIARGDTVEEIERLKSEAGGDIVVHGGVRFAQSLAGLGVVDEYRLLVYPIAVGTGSKLFAEIDGVQELRLASSTAFPAGAVELVYERADAR